MRALLVAALVTFTAYESPLKFYAGVWSGGVCATLGAPRTGKTTGLIAADVAGVFKRRVVFDCYARRDRAEMLRGKPVTPWPGLLITPGELLRNLHHLDDPRLRLVVCPEGTPSDAELGAQFGRLCALLWETGELDILAEEIGRYGRHAVEWVNQIASGGGHAGLRVFACLQSFGRLAKDGRRGVSHIVGYAQGEESDYSALRGRCGKGFEVAVRGLRPADPEAGRPPDPPKFWRLGDGALTTEQS